jgi:hypothetical protein
MAIIQTMLWQAVSMKLSTPRKLAGRSRCIALFPLIYRSLATRRSGTNYAAAFRIAAAAIHLLFAGLRLPRPQTGCGGVAGSAADPGPQAQQNQHLGLPPWAGPAQGRHPDDAPPGAAELPRTRDERPS